MGRTIICINDSDNEEEITIVRLVTGFVDLTEIDEERVPIAEEPIPILEDPIPIVEEPIPIVEEPIPIVEEPIPIVEEPIPIVEEPIPVIEKPILVAEGPVRVMAEPTSVMDESEPIVESVPVVTSDETEEWDVVSFSSASFDDDKKIDDVTNTNGKRLRGPTKVDSPKSLDEELGSLLEIPKKKKKKTNVVTDLDVLTKDKKSKKERKEKNSKKEKKDKKEKKSKKEKKDRKDEKERSKKEKKEQKDEKEKAKKKEKTTKTLNIEDFVMGSKKKKKTQTEKPVSEDPEKKKAKPKKVVDPNAPVKKRVGSPQLAHPITLTDIRIHVKKTKHSKDMIIWNEGKTILKGKYSPDMKKKILMYCDLFKAINIKELTGANLIFPSAVYKDKQSFYFEYPNLAVTKPEEWITKELADLEGNPIKVYERNSMGIKTYDEYILENPTKFKDVHFPIIYATFMWFGTLGFTHRNLNDILVVGDELHFIVPEKIVAVPFKGKNIHTIVLSDVPSDIINNLFGDAFDIHAEFLNTTLETLKAYAGCTLADVEELEKEEEQPIEDEKEEQIDDNEIVNEVENLNDLLPDPISIESLPDLNPRPVLPPVKITILHDLLKDITDVDAICRTMIKNHRSMLRDFA